MRLVFGAWTPTFPPGNINLESFYHSTQYQRTGRFPRMPPGEQLLPGWAQIIYNTAPPPRPRSRHRCKTSISTCLVIPNADNFMLAYNVGAAGVQSVALRLFSSDTNYATTTVTNPAAGYNILRVTKGNFITTGSIDWSNIVRVDVITTAKSTGPGVVNYDALRIEDEDNTDIDYVLIAREVLLTPYVKVAGTSEDIEFSLAVVL
jgi:hypothetical protein